MRRSVFPRVYCTLTFLLVKFSQKTLSQTVCDTPPTDPDVDHYIVGYGSLLNSTSKNSTDPSTGPNIPAEIRGYSRSWNCRSVVTVSKSITFLGVLPNENGVLNGAFFKVPDADTLKRFDARENNYCREEVSRELITVLQAGVDEPPPGTYWTYVPKPESVQFPNWDYPIVQAYVDIFLTGCLEIEAEHKLENFAENCIKTTAEWNHPWVNDRIHPRRPSLYQPAASKIDRLLYTNVQSAFQAIKIE